MVREDVRPRRRFEQLVGEDVDSEDGPVSCIEVPTS